MWALLLYLLLGSGAWFEPDTSGVVQQAISPDGQWLVEISDFQSQHKYELWSTNRATGARRKIGSNVAFDNDVSEFLISPDSSTVVYRMGRTATGDWLLYSTGINALNGFRICQTMTLGGAVDYGIKPTWGGNFVRYRADPVVDETFHWYVVKMTGGRIYEEIMREGFEGGTRGGFR